MGFTLPTFNLAVNLWRNGNAPPAAPDLVTVGNLTPGRRVITPFYLHPAGAQIEANMYLLLPAFTDIRDAKAAGGNDLAEVPAGSGRMYDVAWVDDVAFGFANEHRVAQLAGKGPRPTPFPAGVPAVAVGGAATCATGTLFYRNNWYRTTIPVVLAQFFYRLANPLPIGTNYTLMLAGDAFPVNPNIVQGDCAGPLSNRFAGGGAGTYSFNTIAGFANQIELIATGNAITGPHTFDFFIGP